MIDAHNHLQDPRFEGKVSELVDSMKANGITGCVVNGTAPEDWQAVADLVQRYPGFVLPSFGVHPWKVKGRAVGWQDRLTEFLQRYPTAGIGEIGLDRWIKDHDIDDQRNVFRAQLQLAIELDRPCTIHCLRAWGQLLDELALAPQLPRILVHSFGASIETGKKLAKLGAYFSFSGYFLHPRKVKTVEVFRQLPQDRILVETDAPDMLLPQSERLFYENEDINHPANLVQVRRRLTELIGISNEQLVENTNRWWSPSL